MAFIAEYISGKVLDEVFSKIKKVLTDTKKQVQFDKKDMENALQHHIHSVYTWSNEISFRDMKGTKYITNVYIDLILDLMPQRLKLNSEEKTKLYSSQSGFSDFAGWRTVVV
jgi:hypothetical protein